MPLHFGNNKENIDIEEERRCAFVGITRAKERIYISSYKKSENFYYANQIE